MYKRNLKIYKLKIVTLNRNISLKTSEVKLKIKLLILG